MNANVSLRLMEAADASKIASILQFYAGQAVLLWRNEADILAHAESFLVAELNGEVIACVALHDYSAGLFEIRSLAVVPEYNAQGIGRQLVLKAIDQAGAKSGKRVFALTKKGAFFEKLGFQQGEKELFPQKVWQDCQLCHKRDRCDEDAYYFDIA